MELSARSSFIFVICLWKSNLLESKAFFTIRNFFNVRGVENAFYWPHNNLFCFCLLRTCALEKSPAGENRSFPSSKKSRFQSEAKCEAIDMKMIFNYDANKTHFHKKGFALSLVLKVRFFWNSEMAYWFACQHEHRVRTLCIKCFQRCRSLDVSNCPHSRTKNRFPQGYPNLCV